MPSVRISVDSSRFRERLRRIPGALDRARSRFFHAASQIVIHHTTEEAKRRFGQEQAESGMKSYDPRRPKGHWMRSLKGRPEGRGFVVGPTVDYARFPERGIRGSTFRGHRALERGSVRSVEEVKAAAERAVAEAIDDA